MTQVNKYPNRDAYAADARRSPDKSSISLVEQNGALLCDGVNIVVDASSVGVGDLAVYDRTQGAIRFVKGATLLPARLPAELVPVAVVYAVRGEKVHVVSLDNATLDGAASLRWAAPYEVALAGFDLKAGGTIVLTLGSGAVTAAVSITYPAGATLTDIASAINAGLKGGTLDYSLTNYGGWRASATDDFVVMASNAYTASRAAIDVVSGCEIRRTQEDRNYQTTLTGVLIDGPAEYVRRKNYVTTSWAGCNPEKLLQYCSVNGDVKTGQKPGSAYVLRESVFTEADNLALVAAYPTYRDYLLSENMLQYPAAYGPLLRDGRENTAKIGGLRFTDFRGSSVPCYPAAAAALDYGIAVEEATTGLEVGAWWLPSVEEVYLLMHDRVLSAADSERDPVNRALTRLGKATCYGTGFYTWTSCEYGDGNAYVYYGGTGGVNSNSKIAAHPVRPVSIIHKQ